MSTRRREESSIRCQKMRIEQLGEREVRGVVHRQAVTIREIEGQQNERAAQLDGLEPELVQAVDRGDDNARRQLASAYQGVRQFEPEMRGDLHRDPRAPPRLEVGANHDGARLGQDETEGGRRIDDACPGQPDFSIGAVGPPDLPASSMRSIRRSRSCCIHSASVRPSSGGA